MNRFDSPSDVNSANTVQKQMMIVRIMWFAMMLGELVFFSVVAFAILPNHAPVQPQPLLPWINLAMLITIVPATYLIRRTTFRRAAVNGAVPAGPYTTGNIIFWAGCEGVCFFALVIAMINTSLWPTILIAAVALSLQAITFPVADRLYVPPGPGKTTQAQHT